MHRPSGRRRQVASFAAEACNTVAMTATEMTSRASPRSPSTTLLSVLVAPPLNRILASKLLIECHRQPATSTPAGLPTAAIAIRHWEWCCRTGLNCGPLPYQGSALPLSYGSIGTRQISDHPADVEGCRARGSPAIASGMTDGKGKRGERQAALRAKRAGAALRENLKRRKAQDKARRQGEGQSQEASQESSQETPHETARIVPDKPTG